MKKEDTNTDTKEHERRDYPYRQGTAQKQKTPLGREELLSKNMECEKKNSPIVQPLHAKKCRSCANEKTQKRFGLWKERCRVKNTEKFRGAKRQG